MAEGTGTAGAGPRVVLTVVQEGRNRTFRFRRDVITLGRSSACTLPLEDAALSRVHCQFERQGGALYVRDLDSRNGTWLRGARVQRARLTPGDEISCGTLRVTYDGLEAAAVSRDPFRTLAILGQAAAGRRPGPPDPSQENRRLRRLLRTVRDIVEELESDRILSKIMDTAIELAAAERGFLIVFQGEDLTVEVARSYWEKDVSQPEFEISRHIADRVRTERCGLVVEDAGSDDRFSAFRSVHALQIRSVLCVPLLLRGEVKGVLYLDNRMTRGSFQDTDREFLESFADLSAIALENAGRFAEVSAKKRDLEDLVAEGRSELVKARQALVDREAEQKLRYSFDRLVMRSLAMRELVSALDRITPTDIPVVFEGAAGTEKERLARILHQNGSRSGRPFLSLSCATLPPSLAEVELFGHGAGAFTGAQDSRPGLLESADGGTIYLDGLEDLELDTQALLLRVLESGEFRRVGEVLVRRLDVRVLSGTCSALEERVRAGTFREDLYFRLKGIRIRVPTLAERPDDLPVLLEQVIEENAPGLRLTPRAKKALLLRPWPGNMLELRNEIRRLGTLGGPVDLTDLGPVDPPRGRTIREASEELERRMIVSALRQEGGNLSRAAEVLGLSRLGLRKKLARYGIDRRP